MQLNTKISELYFDPEKYPELHASFQHKYREDSYGYFCPTCCFRMYYFDNVGHVCLNRKCENKYIEDKNV